MTTRHFLVHRFTGNKRNTKIPVIFQIYCNIFITCTYSIQQTAIFVYISKHNTMFAAIGIPRPIRPHLEVGDGTSQGSSNDMSG